MFIFSYMKMAVESIRSNKMRSFLTMLGIIIGIASVIIIVSAGQGAQNFMVSQFEQVGTTTVIVSVDTTEALESEYITMEDVTALGQMGDIVNGVSPLSQRWGQVSFREVEMDTVIAGGTEDVWMFDNVEMLSGRFFTEDDNLGARSVVVIDELICNKFFGTTDVIGLELDFFFGGSGGERAKLRIVGVTKSSYGDFYYEGLPGTAYMPINTMIEILNKDSTFTSVYMMASDGAYTEQLGNTAVSFLEARHNNRGREVYTASNFLSMMDMVTSIMTLIQTFVAAVAAISLVVGGIGVMNIMLVAVTERTREIGIRKSLGARTNAILFQFLTESAILTLIGGAIGLTIGYIGAWIFCTIAGIDPVFEVSTILMTLAFSASVGLFFGIYPANKAAKLHPIEALRHD